MDNILARMIIRMTTRKQRIKIRRFLFGPWYRGDARECPYCGYRYREFRPFHHYKDEACWQCDFFSRHRLLWLYLKNRTNLFQDRLTVLHIAPEVFLNETLHALPNLTYVSADLGSDASESFTIQMDLTAAACASNRFDVVLCNHVLEHIDDDRTAMRELYRVLKLGGWAILQVPHRCCRTCYNQEEGRHFFEGAAYARYYQPYPTRYCRA